MSRLSPNNLRSELDPSDQKRVDAAEGFHMLGDFQSALDEIAAVDARHQDHPQVLHIKCRAHWGLRNIPQALIAVHRFVEVAPEHPFGYIFKAMLLSYDGRHRESYDLLKSVINQFTGHATMHYELAHSAAHCQLWPEACHWLYFAICAEPELKRIALDSPVFAQIASEIEAIHPLQ